MASKFELVEEVQETAPQCDTRIRQALRLIDRELNNHDLTVAHLAAELHLSTSRLRKLFSSELGVTPKRYICNLRLCRTRTLLFEDPSLSIKEVMAAVGFNDPSDFSRAYRRLLGVTPSVCRECLCAQRHDPKCIQSVKCESLGAC